jgi:hypothetical protein
MNKGEQAMAVAKTLLAANKTQQAAGKRAGVSQTTNCSSQHSP